MKFVWRDRAACIRRVSVLLQCTHIDMDNAIDAAIHKTDRTEYRYCNEPQLITPAQREKLRKDVQAYISIPDKLIAAGRNRKA